MILSQHAYTVQRSASQTGFLLKNNILQHRSN